MVVAVWVPTPSGAVEVSSLPALSYVVVVILPLPSTAAVSSWVPALVPADDWSGA